MFHLRNDPSEPPQSHPEGHFPNGFFFSGSFPNSGDPNFHFGFTPGQGFRPPNDGDNDDYDDNDDDGHHVPFGRGLDVPMREPLDIMRHFEEVFKGFDELFRGFGMADIPPSCK